MEKDTISVLRVSIRYAKFAPAPLLFLLQAVVSTLTVICWVVVGWTPQPHVFKERDKPFDATLIDAIAFSHSIQVVEHFEEQSTRLVNRTHNSATLLGQQLQ
jgi:hypothetical protein